MLSKSKINTQYIYMIILSIMLVVRDIIGLPISKYIFVFVIILFAVICKKDELPQLFCFLFPLLWGLPYTWFVAPILIIYIFKRRTISKSALVFIIVFSIHELVSSFWYLSTTYIDILKYLSILAIMFTLLYDEHANKLMCIKSFYVSCIVMGVIILVSTLKNAPSNWLYLFSRGWFRFGETQFEDGSEMMLKMNANSLAYYSIVGMSLGLYLFRRLSLKLKILNVIGIVFLGVIGFLTQSRTWYIVLVISILLYLFSQLKHLKSWIIVLSVGLIVLLFSLRYVKSFPELLESIISRWNNVDIVAGNGRLELFFQYHNVLWSNLRYIFMGTGVTGYKEITGIYHGLHNMIQQVFLCYGLILGLVFFIAIFQPINRSNRCFVKWIPFIATLLFVQMIQFVNPATLMLPYVIAVYAVNLEGQNNE